MSSGDDWLSYFDFSDLPPAPLTQVDLPELFDFDVTDLLSPHEIPPSFDLLEETEKFNGAGHPIKCSFTVEAGTPSLHNSSSTISSPDNSDAGSFVAVVEGASSVKDGLGNQFKSLENHGHAMKCSTIDSVTSTRKRQHENVCSDMEGDDVEGKSQLDSLDRKQQRLLRNRELAFESRQRKKCYVSDLETKCKRLEQERNLLQQQVYFSATENAVLKEELSRIKTMNGREGVAEPAVLFEDSLPLEFLSLLIYVLLTAQLSLCVSPFLALVFGGVTYPQNHIKAERLLKEQVNSNRRFDHIINDIRWLFNHLWFHKPFGMCGLFVVRLTWQVPLLFLIQNFCKSLKGAIT